MFSRRSNEPNHGRPSPLKQLSCIFSLGMPANDATMIEEREFHYKQAQQRHRKNSTALTAADSFSVSCQSSFSWNQQHANATDRQRSGSGDCVPTPLGGGMVIPDDADVFFEAHFPEQSYTVTEICLDADGVDDEEYVEIDEDGCVTAPVRTTCVLRCDDNSLWSDVSDEYGTATAAAKTVRSQHWRDSDADKPFVPPYEIIIVRKHVQFRFEI